VLAALALGAPERASAGHVLLDHAPPSFTPSGPPPAGVISGGPQAEWRLLETFVTGNPLTDLDFFTQGGEMFMSAGTLGIGPNSGGQTIVKLTDGGEVSPSFVASHPSASCVSDPSAALGLQHDVEATPKGDVLFNTKVPQADTSDAQLLLDATDAPGRCHDQGELGIAGAPRGGVEIVDVTDPTSPVEIGLTSHIGEAHTVNVDPKRPHIAYASTSDSVAANEDGTLQNEDPESSQRFNLDGFEVIDLSSCMNFPAGASVAEKRQACRPEVYRYRYPSSAIGLGHTTQDDVYGCHELEVYPNDLLTCGSGNTGILFNTARMFNDQGTPEDYTDDTIRGAALPCSARSTTSVGPFGTAATIMDCVDGAGEGDDDLSVAKWLESGAPAVKGVDVLGTAFHQGRGAGGAVEPAFTSDEDIDFNHEMELTASGRFALATDERGGGVTPPGAACSPVNDLLQGNGGIHAYSVDELLTDRPADAEEAFRSYAEDPEGDRAIFRVPIRTPNPQASFCTAHVFHQIPGQNRIFMGWYSQGTHVIDFTERKDGTLEFEEAGYFIPTAANTWASAVFDFEENADGSFTYWGATADTNLGLGRAAIDVYEVTLPPPPEPLIGDCLRPIEGTTGKDVLTGESTTGDRILGRKGNDTLAGEGKADCIKGGAGNDKIDGGAGKDRLNGNAGRDKLTGAGGGDTLRGGDDPDKIDGGAGKDKIIVRGGGKDRVTCGGGKDKVKAGRNDKVASNCERVQLAKKKR
jgi:hypothetical protein